MLHTDLGAMLDGFEIAGDDVGSVKDVLGDIA